MLTEYQFFFLMFQEKTVLKTGQSDGKGMKRKIIMPSSPQEEEGKSSQYLFVIHTHQKIDSE